MFSFWFITVLITTTYDYFLTKLHIPPTLSCVFLPSIDRAHQVITFLWLLLPQMLSSSSHRSGDLDGPRRKLVA